MMNENISIKKQIAEKEILFSLNKDIASVKDKNDILKLINPKLKQLFNTEDIFISHIDSTNETLNPILRVGSTSRNKHPDYERTVNSNFPIHDGFIDAILNSPEPLVISVDEVNNWSDPPGYMKISKATGLVETLSTSLHHADELIGVLTLWGEASGSFTSHHKKLISEIADQISIIIYKILANEEISQQKNENEILLVISNEIAAILSKDDLSKILASSFRKYFRFYEFIITIYDNEKNAYNAYTYYINEKRLKYSEFRAALTTDYQICGNDISNAHSPILLDVDLLAKKGYKQFVLMQKAGIREIVSLKLVNGDNLIGLFVLLSEQKHSFTERSLRIIQKISYQVSIAVAKLISDEGIQQREEEESILLSLSNEMVLVRNRDDLAKVISHNLKDLFYLKDFAIVSLNGNGMTRVANVFDQKVIPFKKMREYIETLFNNFRFEGGFFDAVLNSKEPVVFNITEIMTRKFVPGHIKFFSSLGIKEIIGYTLRIGKEVIGILWIEPEEVNIFDKINLKIFKGVCSQISIALANIIANEEIQRRDEEESVLLSLSNEIAAVRNKKGLIGVIRTKLKELFLIGCFAMVLIKEDKNTYSSFLLNEDENIKNHPDFKKVASQTYEVTDVVFDRVINSTDPLEIDVYELADKRNASFYVQFWKSLGIRQLVGARLRVGEENMGCLFIHLSPDVPNKINSNLLKGVCSEISIAFSNILANEKIEHQLLEIDSYKQQMEEEKIFLHEEAGREYKFKDIIGSGPGMEKVFHLLSQVSFVNSTVLILGETGTGKELIAHAIHETSPRKNKLMVKVNCAVLPPSLIESELFGHERGSFTGAVGRKMGKFELADKGTLFLDEIGELPLEMQVKLLRVLQEREFERLGGNSTIKTDVRIIAATSRDLQKETEEGRFRLDLYYRLNVFPILLPPLRERLEDIPALAAHFVRKYSKNTGKTINSISANAMKELRAYSWPGNIRELEHTVERSVLMTSGTTIKEIYLSTNNNKKLKQILQDDYLKTYEENERDHIISALKRSNGKIYGPEGAAKMLNLKVGTLNSKIKKLGIEMKKKIDDWG